jgi:hypothetical protein
MSTPPASPVGQPARNQIANLKVTPSATFLGVTVSFRINTLYQVASISLIRSFTKPDLSSTGSGVAAIAAGTFLADVPLQTGVYSYIDGDPAILGKTVYYWVQVVLEIPQAIGSFSSPPPWNPATA